jgi:thiol-disulfide isomerase/thioredoxin
MQVTFSDRRRLLLGLALALSFPLLASAAPPAAGQPAPALTAVSFAGANIDLAELRGKVVVLNFWASWCEPCRREMPLLDSLAQQYHERVVVLGLSADDRHDRKDAVNISHAVSYPTGMLAEAGSNGFGMPQVLPLTYVIDASGRINAVLRASEGALTESQLRASIEAALHEGGSDPVAPVR